MQSNNGPWRGFNSVVLELEIFKKIFKKITWIGSDYSLAKVDNALLAVPSDIPCIALPVIGGKSLWKKLTSIPKGLLYAYHMLKELPKADIIHVRGPNAVMFIAMLMAPFFKKKKWWFKYANNWVDPKPPLFWGIQKRLMRYYTFSVGTVNGRWDSEPNHILSFENPCLQTAEMEVNNNTKQIAPYHFLYVGRLTNAKGVEQVLEILENSKIEKLVSQLTIIGDGPLKQKIKEKATLHKKVHFLGSTEKKVVVETMKKADFLLLPTRSSEGFPKVIAEAWKEGCIPIVSDVSSIGQYVIDNETGFLWEGKLTFHEFVYSKLSERTDYSMMNEHIQNVIPRFTYEHYEQQIRERILSN